MLQYKTTEKKIFKPISESRREMIARTDSLDFLENQMVRHVERNDNVNLQLTSNYNQIRELLKDRKVLLRAKHEMLIMKNKERVNSIAHARDQDLRNEAKLLNDPSITNLVDHAQSLNKSKSLLLRISQTKDMNGFATAQLVTGKKFWDRHKQFEREKKKKLQMYTNFSKQLKQYNKKEREIFLDIQRCQNQIVNLLFKNRDDPDHIKRAQRLNQQVEKYKNILKDLKTQKAKLKSKIQDIIDQILQFNRINEDIFKKRYKELDEVFAGNENMSQLQNLMQALERIIISKSQQNNRNQNVPAAAQHFVDIFRNYDIVISEIEKLREDEDHLFGLVNEELRENIRNAVMEKAFFAGVPVKQGQGQLLRKCKEYKKLLFELNEDRPRLQSQIQKVNSMSSMLYPIKKAYATEDVRRQDLKREIKRLCSMNLDLEAKDKQLRNFQFDMEDLVHKRKAIEIEINDSAQKVNLVDYKNKMRELQAINKKISQKNDAILNEQMMRMRDEIEDYYNRLYDQYQDLISEVEMNEQQLSLGVFLTKLQKRLSLV